MPTFTPPAQNVIPPVLPVGDPEQTPEGYALFRHFRARPEGRNVYVLSDDTVTEDDPDGTSASWAAGEGIPHVVHAFYGGHDDYNISEAVADLLTDEGYEVTP